MKTLLVNIIAMCAVSLIACRENNLPWMVVEGEYRTLVQLKLRFGPPAEKRMLTREQAVKEISNPAGRQRLTNDFPRVDHFTRATWRDESSGFRRAMVCISDSERGSVVSLQIESSAR